MDYQVSGESLTAVADAIRERAGKTEQLAFPEEYESVVRGIPDFLGMLIEDNLVEYSNPAAKIDCSYAFTERRNLVKVSLPSNTQTGYLGFANCNKLSEVFMPSLLYIHWGGFQNCNLSTVDFPALIAINGDGFKNNPLTALILRRTDGIVTVTEVAALSGTPIANGTGYIYVPRSLVDSYKAATNWSTYANQIRAIEDYPEITGG